LDAELFLLEVERILQEQVKNSFPTDWDEDFITMNTLREIRKKLNIVKIKGFKRGMKIEWTCFKLGRPPEKKFGDVALLMNISYQDGDKIEGVAFLEAKKRTIGKIKFEAMKTAQLKRICRNAPSSMTLLFDYEDVTQFANTEAFSERWSWLVLKPCTCSVVVPINTILSVGKKDTTLYKFSLPFSYQLFFRYFQGFDLEFRESSIKIAKGYAIKKGVPKYLMVISVAFGTAEPFRDIDFNRNLFSEME